MTDAVLTKQRIAIFIQSWATTLLICLIIGLVQAFIDTGTLTKIDDSNHPSFINWFLKPMILGQTLHNMGIMEDYLESECKDIEYTAVKPPQLTNVESSGKPVYSHEGQLVPGKSHSVSRRDVAKFMLDVAEHGNYKGKLIAITSAE